MWLSLIYLEHFVRVDLLPCSTSVCQNGGSCYNNGLQDVCRCAPGYTGQHCETGTHTHTHTHMHRTTVHQIWMMWNHCRPCPVCAEVDECQPNPCLNGATCLDGPVSFTCVCLPSYTGELCEKGQLRVTFKTNICRSVPI